MEVNIHLFLAAAENEEGKSFFFAPFIERVFRRRQSNRSWMTEEEGWSNFASQRRPERIHFQGGVTLNVGAERDRDELNFNLLFKLSSVAPKVSRLLPGVWLILFGEGNTAVVVKKVRHNNGDCSKKKYVH